MFLATLQTVFLPPSGTVSLLPSGHPVLVPTLHTWSLLPFGHLANHVHHTTRSLCLSWLSYKPCFFYRPACVPGHLVDCVSPTVCQSVCSTVWLSCVPGNLADRLSPTVWSPCIPYSTHCLSYHLAILQIMSTIPPGYCVSPGNLANRVSRTGYPVFLATLQTVSLLPSGHHASTTVWPPCVAGHLANLVSPTV